MLKRLHLILLFGSILALVIFFQPSLSFGTAFLDLSFSQLVTSRPEARNQTNQANSATFLPLSAHHNNIILLSFSADGRFLASADSRSIVIWSVETGEVLRILPAHYLSRSPIGIIAPTSLSLSPNGRFVASSTWTQGSLDPQKSVIVWDTQTGEEIFNLDNHKGCRQVLFGDDDGKLYTTCDYGIQVWELDSKQQIASFNDRYPVETITLSTDGKVMASVDANISNKQPQANSDPIKIWKINDTSIKLLSSLEGHNNEIAQLDFTARDRQLVSSSYDGSIKIWNWQKNQEEKTLNQTSENGLFSFNSNGRYIAGNFLAGKVLNVPRSTLLETPISVPFQGKASAVAFSPDGNILAWATKSDNFPNPTLILWQIKGDLNIDSYENKVRNSYDPLNLTRFWSDQANNTLSFIGHDPKLIAVAALGLNQKFESEKEEVELTYPQYNKAVVNISQTNLPDDSVFGIRYRVEFAPYGHISDDKQWQVIWAGKQYRCQPNRGHQNWSTTLCN